MPLTGNINLGSRLTLTGTDDFGIPQHIINMANDMAITDGAGANQMNQVWADAGRTLAASANDDLDLSGVLVNKLGTTVAFARVKFIYIKVVTTTAGYTLNVGGGSNPFVTHLTGTTPVIVLRAGGALCLVAPDATGYVVTAGTADILRINNPSGGTITYDIIIAGSTT
jgi:hypothetical protein